jgi:hypothetical protein
MTDEVTVTLVVPVAVETAEQIDRLRRKFVCAPPSREDMARWLIETALFNLAADADRIRAG